MSMFSGSSESGPQILLALRSSPLATCNQCSFITNGDAHALGVQNVRMELTDTDREALGIQKDKKMEGGGGDYKPKGEIVVKGDAPTHEFTTYKHVQVGQEKLGYSCSVQCAEIENNVFQLNISKGGTDYYFPYVLADSGGAGMCKIPFGVPDGTLALTGSMNGCALEVRRVSDGFLFYHDANGTCLANSPLQMGVLVCRVDAARYEGPGRVGFNTSLPYQRPPNTTDWLGRTVMHSMLYFEHGIICVKNGNRWGVYATGVFKKNTKRRNLIGVDWEITGEEWTRFSPLQRSLVAEFEDARFM